MLQHPGYYRRNASQNNNKKSNPSDHPQKSTNNKWEEGQEERETPYTTGGKGHWQQSLERDSHHIQKQNTLKRTMPRIWHSHTWAWYPDKTTIQNDTHTPMFTAVLLKTARHTAIKMCTDRLKLKEDVVHISTWSFTQPSAVNSAEKESKKNRHPLCMSMLNQVLYTDSKHKTTNWLYSNTGSAWGKEKSNAYFIPATSLSWAAIPSLEPEQAVSSLDWDSIEKAR